MHTSLPTAASSFYTRQAEIKMASFCRSAAIAGARSLAGRSRTVAQRSLNSKPISSPFCPLTSPSPTRSFLSTARAVSVFGRVDSLMPLHTATANARLRSNIAVDSSCWSWLSQGFATPL